MPERLTNQHHGAGAARLIREKQALDLIALRTELFECMTADAALMPVEKVQRVGAGELLHARERLSTQFYSCIIP